MSALDQQGDGSLILFRFRQALFSREALFRGAAGAISTSVGIIIFVGGPVLDALAFGIPVGAFSGLLVHGYWERQEEPLRLEEEGRELASRDPNIIKGVGASNGNAHGQAKVVQSLSDVYKVQPGDVLVCEMTTPEWTPVLSTVSAIVADKGGVLSHCALAAKKFHLPCVVHTRRRDRTYQGRHARHR